MSQAERNALIGERVRFYRTSKELSLEKLANSLPTPVSGQQLAKYETGVSRWPADLLVDIAVKMRIDIRLLTGLESGKHEGKDTPEWEAEKYKSIILSLSERTRKVIFKIIDGVATLQ